MPPKEEKNQQEVALSEREKALDARGKALYEKEEDIGGRESRVLALMEEIVQKQEGLREWERQLREREAALIPAVVSSTGEPAQIDPRYLTGLKLRGSTAMKVEKDGEEKIRYRPYERELTAADVLSWTDKGDTVVITTADGQKHAVQKVK